jgi:hypothetical protein
MGSKFLEQGVFLTPKTWRMVSSIKLDKVSILWLASLYGNHFGNKELKIIHNTTEGNKEV